MQYFYKSSEMIESYCRLTLFVKKGDTIKLDGTKVKAEINR
jgi:hypothetical protein